jgi:hypothetical protein
MRISLSFSPYFSLHQDIKKISPRSKRELCCSSRLSAPTEKPEDAKVSVFEILVMPASR